MDRFLKGIVVGIGGIAPGLSGSVLLIIFGLYQKTLEALGNLLRDLRKNLTFLLPLAVGMGAGVLLFSRVIDFCLTQFEGQTRFCFLGLILGTVPTVWKEVRKEGFRPACYGVILLSAAAGLWLFTLNADAFPQVTDPTLLQSVLLGVAVAATAIIPGLDPTAVLSSLGLYEMYVGALARVDLVILAPMVLGLAAGAMVISYGMSRLFRRFYTMTYSVIFGVFLTMIPHMLTPGCILSASAAILMALGFGLSLFLGDLQNNLARIRKRLHK